jgi:hypothetical protein
MWLPAGPSKECPAWLANDIDHIHELATFLLECTSQTWGMQCAAMQVGKQKVVQVFLASIPIIRNWVVLLDLRDSDLFSFNVKMIAAYQSSGIGNIIIAKLISVTVYRHTLNSCCDMDLSISYVDVLCSI